MAKSLMNCRMAICVYFVTGEEGDSMTALRVVDAAFESGNTGFAKWIIESIDDERCMKSKRLVNARPDVVITGIYFFRFMPLSD